MKYLITAALISAAVACGQQEPDVERVYITRISPSPVPGPAGERGQAGEPGVAGERGETGQPGAIGATGEQGETGITGTDGTAGIDGTDGVDGQDGDIGPEGPVGPVGPAGATGPAGTNGTTYSFVVQAQAVCTQVGVHSYWVLNNSVYSADTCANAGKLGTLGNGNEFWLTVNLSLIRLGSVMYRKEQVN